LVVTRGDRQRSCRGRPAHVVFQTGLPALAALTTHSSGIHRGSRWRRRRLAFFEVSPPRVAFPYAPVGDSYTCLRAVCGPQWFASRSISSGLSAKEPFALLAGESGTALAISRGAGAGTGRRAKGW